MKITILGGGTGTFTALTGLKEHPELDLAAIVSCADNGGSSGVLRDELGVLPPGDIRQCLVALADSGLELRGLLSFRFTEGPCAGHPMGNLILSALDKMVGDPLEAVRVAQRLFKVRGEVIPVSARATNLAVELADGSYVDGEHLIDSLRDAADIKRCFLRESTPANPAAIRAIEESNLVVLGPGDLFTSIIPVLLVEGIREALARTEARLLYVLNLATKPGHTEHFTAKRFCTELHHYLGDDVRYSALVNNEPPAPHLVDRYESAHERLVIDDLNPRDPHVIRRELLTSRIQSLVPGDRIQRSLLRHDPDKLAEAILEFASFSR